MRPEFTKEEYKEMIEARTLKINAYNNTIENNNNQVVELLNGQPLKTEREDGMFNFHPESKKIKKIEFETAKMTLSIRNVQKDLDEIVEDFKNDYPINGKEKK